MAWMISPMCVGVYGELCLELLKSISSKCTRDHARPNKEAVTVAHATKMVLAATPIDLAKVIRILLEDKVTTLKDLDEKDRRRSSPTRYSSQEFLHLRHSPQGRGNTVQELLPVYL